MAMRNSPLASTLSFGGDFHHKDKKVWVLSNSRTGKDENVEYFNDLAALIKKLKKEKGKDIYCDGGGDLVLELLKHSFIDRVVVSVIPHLLGSGIIYGVFSLIPATKT